MYKSTVKTTSHEIGNNAGWPPSREWRSRAARKPLRNNIDASTTKTLAVNMGAVSAVFADTMEETALQEANASDSATWVYRWVNGCAQGRAPANATPTHTVVMLGALDLFPPCIRRHLTPAISGGVRSARRLPWLQAA